MKIRPVKALDPVFDVHVVGMFQLGRIFMLLRPSESWDVVPEPYRRQLTITVNAN